jgi:hypothetical protein
MNPPDSEAAIAWRVQTLEQAIKDERATRRQEHDKLDVEKADAKDVARLADEFKSLRLTLQWFMGIVAVFAITVITLVIQQGAT